MFDISIYILSTSTWIERKFDFDRKIFGTKVNRKKWNIFMRACVSCSGRILRLKNHYLNVIRFPVHLWLHKRHSEKRIWIGAVTVLLHAVYRIVICITWHAPSIWSPVICIAISHSLFLLQYRFYFNPMAVSFPPFSSNCISEERKSSNLKPIKIKHESCFRFWKLCHEPKTVDREIIILEAIKLTAEFNKR